MAGINPKEFLDELVFCINEEDIVKAKALLQFASDSDIDVSVQKQAMALLGNAHESIAFPLLEHLTKVRIKNPDVQEIIYDLILEKSYGNTELVLRYIQQDNKKTRLIYIRAAGDLQLAETAPVLKKLIASGNDNEIMAEAIRSLGSLRLADSLDTLTAAARHSDAAIRRNAIFAMAELGGRPAVDALKTAVTGSGETDLIAIEALAAIQDQYALETLTSFLSSSQTHVRDAAIDQLIDIGAKSVPTITHAAHNAQSDYMIHLITTLGYIGDQAAVPVILDIINIKPKDANIRQSLYEALERIPSAKSAISLAGGLQDPVEAVRLSAARAVDRNLSKVLVAGLKNIIKENNESSRRTVSALIDSGAEAVFNFVIDEPAFLDIAEEHITRSADPATRDAFIKLIASKNKPDVTDRFRAIAAECSGPEVPCPGREYTIYVIDDSKMMLKLYQNKLVNQGYKPTVFQFPEEAISAVHVNKPDLVITDLNMPKINGIQLTLELRRKYTRQELPIVMITTQSDFIDMGDGDHASRVDESYLAKTGINRVLHKPFTDETLKECISEYLK